MADSTKGVGETKGSEPNPKQSKKRVYAKNLAPQPREFKISGKWYRWNACGTEGDTLDVTHIKLGNLSKYFEIKEY